MITGTFGNFAHRNAAPASSLNDNGGEKTAEPLRDWLHDHGVRVRCRRTCERPVKFWNRLASFQ